ncbi:unnamed protein product [Nezara viridula]|uniref:EF-hand domain-containing protein n=1 Tax=Nezara viridula TaxID=85310 RepID=A0A9P0HKQ9_NEZVI|nr:unnamed protein product [Nezara viridula]
MPTNPQSQTSWANQGMMYQANKTAESTLDPLEKLRLLCLSRGSEGLLEFGRVIRRKESDDLTLEEFKEVIRDADYQLTGDQIESLFEAFDTEGSGTISATEFINAIRPEMSDTRKKSVNDAFDKCDKAKAGVITLEELRDLCSVRAHPKYRSGEMTENEILRKFMATFERGSVDGNITREEFFNYYAGVSASIDTDTCFDLMLRQAFHL